MLRTFFDATSETGLDEKQETWPLGTSPFIRLDSKGRRPVESGMFGLVPSFATEIAYGFNTYNSRTETVVTKSSFKDAWRLSRRCVIPAEYIFEPYYEPVLPNEPQGPSVRRKILAASGDPLAIAGLYNTWYSPSGKAIRTFTMLMVNTDKHPFMSKFHGLYDEKRMALILDRDEIDDWLTCPPGEATKYFRMWHGELTGEPAPLAPRQSKPKVQNAPKPPKPPQPYIPDLFE